MAGAERFQRYELKYLLPLEMQDVIREQIAPYVIRDPHSLAVRNNRYTVRSTYYDTQDFQFYFERQDGLKVRKKLRVRGYNLAKKDAPLFLEIKRKYDRAVFKERIVITRSNLDNVLDGNEPDPERHLWSQALPARQTLGRFRYLVTAADLRPSVVVVYEREAFVGREQDRTRVTFDMNLRSGFTPENGDPHDESDLRIFLDGSFVLELKFDLTMPVWMRRLTQRLNLTAQAYSKYCIGIDAWCCLTE